jgi:hypothetical protein
MSADVARGLPSVTLEAKAARWPGLPLAPQDELHQIC